MSLHLWREEEWRGASAILAAWSLRGPIMNTKFALTALSSLLSIAFGTAFGQPVYRMTDIGNIGGSFTGGRSINSSGMVAGVAENSNGRLRAFRWNGRTIQSFGTFGGPSSFAEAINDSRQTTGGARTSAEKSHAFIWDGGTRQDLGTLGGSESIGFDINNSGQVAGEADLTGDLDRHAFLWDGFTMRDLGTLGGNFSSAAAINSFGQVVGTARMANSFGHAFFWDGSTMRDIHTHSAARSQGEFINDAGHVAGQLFDAQFSSGSAFFWNGSTMQDLGALGGSLSVARAMNANGQVTGNATLPNNGASHAFLWDSGAMIDLGTLGGINSVGWDVNDSGQVTGDSLILDDATNHGFLWDNGTLYDLNKLVDVSDPLRRFVTIISGLKINNDGYVMAFGDNSQQKCCGSTFVLSPAAPANLKASTGLSGTGPETKAFVRLTWSDPFSDESEFRIERSRVVGTGADRVCGTFSPLATANRNAVSFGDNTVIRAVQYCYQLRSIRTSKVLTLSNVARIRTM
jgi:probable HAF family extracellular repeat protein